MSPGGPGIVARPGESCSGGGRGAAPAGVGARGRDRPAPGYRPRTASRGARPPASVAPGAWHAPAEHLPQLSNLLGGSSGGPAQAQRGIGGVPSRRPWAGVGTQWPSQLPRPPRRSLCGSCPAHRSWRPSSRLRAAAACFPCPRTPAPGHSLPGLPTPGLPVCLPSGRPSVTQPGRLRCYLTEGSPPRTGVQGSCSQGHRPVAGGGSECTSGQGSWVHLGTPNFLTR